jgi:phenylacetate-CoA ligase
MRDAFAPVVRHVIYPLWMAKDNSPEIQYLRALRRSQFLPAAAIAELQWNRLQAILEHAYATIPFHRNRFRQAGITPADIREPRDLLRIPPVSKQDIQQNREAMVSETVDRSRLITDRSGGSTGAPVVFYYDLDRLASRQAATIRQNEWAGWRVGDKVALLWAAPRDIPPTGGWKRSLRRRLLERTMILDASSLTEAKMAAFTDLLRTYRPRILLGYANTMTLYARYARERRIRDLRPAAIVCSAEVLRESDRTLIQETFDCPVFNRYGSRELAVIASECEARQGLHINAENLYVELVRNGGHAAPGETGEVIVTDLVNRVMPLIRYRIMDVAMPLAGTCSCGRGLPRIEMQEGRVTDFIVTPEGTAISGVALATYVVPNIPGLRKAQILQEEIGRVTLRAVVDEGLGAAVADTFRGKVRGFVGDRMEIAVDIVADIPVEESGKFRFIVSSLPPETILTAAGTREPHSQK